MSAAEQPHLGRSALIAGNSVRFAARGQRLESAFQPLLARGPASLSCLGIEVGPETFEPDQLSSFGGDLVELVSPVT